MAKIRLALTKSIDALIVVPPSVMAAVVVVVKLVPSISIVIWPPLPPVQGFAGADTVRSLVCVAVRVNPALAAAPLTLWARM